MSDKEIMYIILIAIVLVPNHKRIGRRLHLFHEKRQVSELDFHFIEGQTVAIAVRPLPPIDPHKKDVDPIKTKDEK